MSAKLKFKTIASGDCVQFPIRVKKRPGASPELFDIIDADGAYMGTTYSREMGRVLIGEMVFRGKYSNRLVEYLIDEVEDIQESLERIEEDVVWYSDNYETHKYLKRLMLESISAAEEIVEALA